MTWKPIDLAPRDGAEIVVLFRSSLTGGVSAAVSRWAAEGWERPSERTITEALGDVAFAWAPLPEDMGGV